MSVEIVYPTEELFQGYYEAIAAVGSERVFIEIIEPPPFEKIAEFQRNLIKANGPVYYAVDSGRVIGWCDVFPMTNPRLAHRGELGMGLFPEYRGKGVGTRLLQAVIEHSRRIGLEKIELKVYTSNKTAIALYEKHGFEREGVIKNYRKLDGQVFDVLAMAKFL